MELLYSFYSRFPFRSEELDYCMNRNHFHWKKIDIALFLWYLKHILLAIINFGIMIRCKINFDVIWYSVIFAANFYLSIFVWSFDILNFVSMNVVILVLLFFSSIYSLFSSDFIKDISFVYYIKNIPWFKSTQIKLNHKFFVDKYIMLALKLKWVVISFIQLNINLLGISLTN